MVSPNQFSERWGTKMNLDQINDMLAQAAEENYQERLNEEYLDMMHLLNDQCFAMMMLDGR